MQGTAGVLLHETAMATALGAEGLDFGLVGFFFFAFLFLAIGHLREIYQGVAIPGRFLQTCSTFHEVPLTPAMGTLLGMVGCSLEQGQPCGGHTGCPVFVSQTRGDIKD